MAWMPARFLLRGLLDNRKPGRVTGWMRFAGMPLMVLIELEGDFTGRIRGRRIVLAGDGQPEDPRARRAMEVFALYQTGHILRMAIDEPVEGVQRACLAWSSDQNGQVMLELEPDQLHVVGEPTLMRPRHAIDINSRVPGRVGAGTRRRSGQP